MDQTPFTITSGQGKDKFATPASDGIPFSIASSGSAASITVSLSDSSFASLRGNIESQNMTPESATEDETNIFRGFCRVQITAGSGTSAANVLDQINARSLNAKRNANIRLIGFN